jgi:hypothetical protein
MSTITVTGVRVHTNTGAIDYPGASKVGQTAEAALVVGDDNGDAIALFAKGQFYYGELLYTVTSTAEEIGESLTHGIAVGLAADEPQCAG